MRTEREILALKKEVTDLRDKIIQAKATYNEVIKNIENYENELRELGIDPEKTDDAIQEMENKIEELYQNAKSKLDEWTNNQG
ncbi:MAG: hypothetical protein N2749_00960 [Clostridia bacterium]|nr:hypothetical protein [Clostridia bacterium]